MKGDVSAEEMDEMDEENQILRDEFPSMQEELQSLAAKLEMAKRKT